MSFYGTDFYAYTKKIGEQICQFYNERHGIEVIILRPADFTPYQDIRNYGERLLHGGVDRRDVIQAVVLATECKSTYGAYRIVRQDPFTKEDVEMYSKSPAEIWDRLLPSEIRVTDLSKEKQELGYTPKYHFGTFIQEFIKDGVITS